MSQIIQGRLGYGMKWEIIMALLIAHDDRPGRIHHCMRSIGIAQAALDLMLERVTDPKKKTFGKYLHEHGIVYRVQPLNRLMTLIQGPLSRILLVAGQKSKVHVFWYLVQLCR